MANNIHLRGKPKDKRHPNFKTGIIKAIHNYILVFVGKHHHLADCRGYAYQHRINAEVMLGRKLSRTEYVHHIDEDPTNNNFNNLKVYPTRAHHFEQHRKKDSNKKKADETNPSIKCGCGCGQLFLKYDKSNRPRKFISGHNMKNNG